MIPFVNLNNPLPTTPGTGLTAGQEAELAAATRRQPAATIAALKAITGHQNGDVVFVAAYATAGDGGGGHFRFNSSSSATANNGTIVAPDAGSGRWERVYSGPANIRWFGAKQDGSTNDAAAVQAAVDAAGSAFIPRSALATSLSSLVNIATDQRVVGDGSPIRVATGGGVSLKGAGSSLRGVKIVAATGFSGSAVTVRGFPLFADRHRPSVRDCSFRGNTGEATALELVSDTAGESLAFVVLDSLNFRGWEYAIRMRANAPSGMCYVNSTLATNIYFNGLTTNCIWIEEEGNAGSEEVSGNSFSNIHFQADSTMQKAIKLTGARVRGNMFSNVHVWDVTTAGSNPVIDINNGNSNYICGLMGSRGTHWSVSQYNIAVSIRDADDDTYRMELQLGKRRLRGPSDSPGVINTSTSTTEPAVTNVAILRFTNTGPVSVTRLTVGAGFIGRKLLVRGDGFTTLTPTDSGEGRLHSSIGTLLLATDTFYEFVWDGSYWYRIS